MDVTRVEIAENVEDAFGGSPVSKSELLAAATTTHARPAVLASLQTLPDRRFVTLRDLWSHLPQVPVDRAS